MNFPPILDQLGFSCFLHKKNPPSRCSKILKVVFYPFCFLAKTFENLFYRLIDPNFKFFVSKCRGHFFQKKYKKQFFEALEKADQVFKTVIQNAEEEREWHHLYAKINLLNTKEDRWKRFTGPQKGTCFGNSIAFIHALSKKKKILSIKELKQIEKSEKFATLAILIQLVQSIIIELNLACQKACQEGTLKTQDFTTGLKRLDLTLEEYEKSPYQQKIDQLVSLGVKKKDLYGHSVAEFLFQRKEDKDFNYSLAVLKKYLKEKMLIPIKPGVIDQLTLISPCRSRGTYPIKDLSEMFFSTPKSPEPCLFLIDVLPSSPTKSGHTTFLEADPQNNTYIYYDVNYGYYQWNDLKSCIAGIKKHLLAEEYDFDFASIYSYPTDFI